MAKLWIANTTKQHIEFYYRIPELPKLFPMRIAIGRQEMAYKDDLSTPEIEALIRQLEFQYAAVSVTALNRAKHFVGICYSIDKMIPADVIERGVRHNDGVLTDQGHEFRKMAAVATHTALDKAEQRPNNLAQTSVEVVEDLQRGQKDGIDTTIEVIPEGRKPRRARG